MIGQGEMGRTALGEIHKERTRTDAERSGPFPPVMHKERKKPASGKRQIVRGGKRR